MGKLFEKKKCQIHNRYIEIYYRQASLFAWLCLDPLMQILATAVQGVEKMCSPEPVEGILH